MIEEMRRVFGALWVEDRSLLDFDADFTCEWPTGSTLWIRWYRGDEFRDAVAQRQSVGLIDSGWLVVSDVGRQASRSNVGRVLNNYSVPNPAAIPDVDGLLEWIKTRPLGTLNNIELTECAACHTNMDAIGFGLEQFDAIGTYREMDKDEVIEPAGTLSAGVISRMLLGGSCGPCQ